MPGMTDYRIDLEPQLTVTAAILILIAVSVVWGMARRLTGAPLGVSQRYGLITLRLLSFGLLTALLLNPVKLFDSKGAKQKGDAFYLLDSSQSMSNGDEGSRWDRSLKMIRDSEQVGGEPVANVSLFRFGQHLAAVEPQVWQQPNSEFMPHDSDTQLASALRQLTSRFGRTPPGAIVVFSDGRARDAADIESVAGHYAKLKVPVHVVPVGDATKGGDLAIVGVVSPPKVRKNSQVEVRVFLRSYGYDEKRCELTVSALDREGNRRKLNSLPITVRSGIQSFTTSYHVGEIGQKMEVAVTPLSGEMSVENNRYDFQVAVDRTKVRVLYVEGGPQLSFNITSNITFQENGSAPATRGPHTDLQAALSADPDIECVVLAAIPGNRRLQRMGENLAFGSNRGFPETIAELAAFDAIILSNVARRAFTDEQLGWIDQWIEKRGGGLCMVGGPNSFAAGGWEGEAIGNMLPVELGESASEWNPINGIKLNPASSSLTHPIWHIVENDAANRELLKKIPEFTGIHRDQPLKSQASAIVLATADLNGTTVPVVTAGTYGKGRTMAMSVAVTPPWASEFVKNWGESDHRYYAKFWRNVIYWLTEDSSIGRRRLIAKADQPFYRPAEKIMLSGGAYDESANRTASYRLVAMIEPQGTLDNTDPVWSPIRWPDALPRTSGETGPYIAWGEEFELPHIQGDLDYNLQLVLGPAPAAAAATQSIRLELTAYEETTQVDSTSIDLRIVHDPYEQQNPFPDHELLNQLALSSGGKVFRDAESLRAMLEELPVPPPTFQVRKSPWWSQPWILGLIIGLMTTEWFWRRRLGLG